MKCYIASGWFTPEWDRELTEIRDTVLKHGYEAFVPRDFFICPPDADQQTQKETYDGNIHHLKDSDILIANTRAKDVGTMVEVGLFRGFTLGMEHALRLATGNPNAVIPSLEKPIIYFCADLPPGGKFNLMLSQSGVKVCTSIAELDDYLRRCSAAGRILVEPYTGHIQ